METIDITPKWKCAVQIMLAVLDNPKATKEAKAEMKIYQGQFIENNLEVNSIVYLLSKNFTIVHVKITMRK